MWKRLHASLDLTGFFKQPANGRPVTVLIYNNFYLFPNPFLGLDCKQLTGKEETALILGTFAMQTLPIRKKFAFYQISSSSFIYIYIYVLMCNADLFRPCGEENLGTVY